MKPFRPKAANHIYKPMSKLQTLAVNRNWKRLLIKGAIGNLKHCVPFMYTALSALQEQMLYEVDIQWNAQKALLINVPPVQTKISLDK